jgi:hypothetical protein
MQAELHSANARVQELLARLQDAKNRRDPTRQQLLEQVHNLQNLLLTMRAVGRSGSESTPPSDGLLTGLDMGSDNAMNAGAEKLCMQKTKEAEMIQVCCAALDCCIKLQKKKSNVSETFVEKNPRFF